MIGEIILQIGDVRNCKPDIILAELMGRLHWPPDPGQRRVFVSHQI